MPSRTRFLSSGVTSPSPSSSPPPPVTALDSDFAVILAALLCALICVLGLVAVARCSWIRRFSGRTSTESGPPAAANKGLKKKVLKSLPKQTVGEDEPAEKLSECAICLAEFAAGEEIRVLPQCGHSFHVGCIDMWLKSHSSCPSCRAILVVARCKKCGSLPAAVAGAQPELSQNHVDSFLP
ncbi:RING-H2 finger protein atl80 [Castilleja foliolosa]|uniref:RING-H2 finger protein atl80 n=1 Tax=Castilleja foliolosa TaxID=1961234 RepID=A0ABD3BLQ9_9LAMI